MNALFCYYARMVDETCLRTLVLIVDNNRILLGRKKRGFGVGKWNGFGGKIEPGEALEEAARRELTEEAGITATELEQRGVLSFTFAKGLDPIEMHVFVATAWQGIPAETEEMAPQWWLVKAMPYSQMWADDPHWLPLLLAGEYFVGSFFFTDTEELLHWTVKSVAPEALPWHV